ncbi:MAG: anhydro-N-acetylmuramic acid kinase [Gammaproteobacteria bacterium]|nr:MAG: anhydro-N-acetylmuramic acid kinase [Gammaproteobacteria bacterium]
MPELYIGIMSGTSADAIDCVLVDLSQNNIRLVASHNQPIPADLRTQIHDLAKNGSRELQRSMQLDVQLGRLFAASVLELLETSAYRAKDIHAIGCHGQTVRHQPDGDYRTSMQLGDPNIIAQTTGITTISDFRRRDMAVGGQGAPLVPAFHSALFRHNRRNRVIINIGGIANITVLPADHHRPVMGFDTGPGNVLMDQWINKHQKCSMDKSGHWAASGKVIDDLLVRLLRDRYFQRPPPKSTGTDYFNLPWLEKVLKRHDKRMLRKNVQASLCELTARSIADAIIHTAPAVDEVLVCGGGARNVALMYRLQSILHPAIVQSTEDHGLSPDWVEAVAFAWLAKRTLKHQSGNLKEVTGASETVILGGIYPGKKLR